MFLLKIYFTNMKDQSNFCYKNDNICCKIRRYLILKFKGKLFCKFVVLLLLYHSQVLIVTVIYTSIL